MPRRGATYHLRQEQQRYADIAAYLSKDNDFEWNPRDTCDHDMFNKILSEGNKMFKNNEPVEKYNTSDFIVKDSIFLNIDTVSLNFEDDTLCCEITRWYLPAYLLSVDSDFPQEKCKNFRVSRLKLAKNSDDMSI